MLSQYIMVVESVHKCVSVIGIFNFLTTKGFNVAAKWAANNSIRGMVVAFLGATCPFAKTRREEAEPSSYAACK